MSAHLMLSLLGGPDPTEFAVAQWPPSAEVPPGVLAGSFFNLTRSEDELSLVCEARLLPPGVKHEAGWAAFKLRGPFDFGLTGILAAVLNPLHAAGVGIFAVSTFDTDYVLVKSEQLGAAKAALRAAGHTVQD
ncbi:ACT domain-containing protein [Deinococcus irradiatisoli]|uniref:ACT domain-containing protein n=1 Tax=Deinococcus irradiatisoli TaxID=2202254 RepID=A0A2Z3JBG2_9DEIO|nr:ACT domain-containing protein [Deinococcus irradiatisoli]AWN22315.1 ACT domain-containing protein [Deinococcus irradiatisoli]